MQQLRQTEERRAHDHAVKMWLADVDKMQMEMTHDAKMREMKVQENMIQREFNASLNRFELWKRNSDRMLAEKEEQLARETAARREAERHCDDLQRSLEEVLQVAKRALSEVNKERFEKRRKIYEHLEWELGEVEGDVELGHLSSDIFNDGQMMLDGKAMGAVEIADVVADVEWLTDDAEAYRRYAHLFLDSYGMSLEEVDDYVFPVAGQPIPARMIRILNHVGNLRMVKAYRDWDEWQIDRRVIMGIAKNTSRHAWNQMEDEERSRELQAGGELDECLKEAEQCWYELVQSS